MVNEERPITQKIEAMQELLNNEEIQKMWMKMHTPWIRKDKKVGRNDLCPCGSGKKFKNCTCYALKDNSKYRLDLKHTKGWR